MVLLYKDLIRAASNSRAFSFRAVSLLEDQVEVLDSRGRFLGVFLILVLNGAPRLDLRFDILATPLNGIRHGRFVYDLNRRSRFLCWWGWLKIAFELWRIPF